MSNVFTNKQNETMQQRQLLESRYNSARHNLLLIVAFTLINIVLLVTQSNTYFLFSAYVPYLIVDIGMALCGKYPAEYYGDLTGVEFFGQEFLIATVVIAAVILLLYLLSWIFSNKSRVGWMIFALVFFGIDTVAMLSLNGISMDMIVDIVFHGWVVISLISGISAHYKLKKLPPEEVQTEVLAEEAPQQLD